MTIAHESHRQRIEAGIGFEWDCLPERHFDMNDVPAHATALSFHRRKDSHRGIGELQDLDTLWAHEVNQAFLEEICTIPSIRVLFMEFVRATDLACLESLPRLERLIVKDATKLTDLEWARPLRSVRALGLENLKRVSSLEPLADLAQLTAVGVEGSMWTPMRVASLEPLSHLQQLRSVFLTSLRAADRSLRPLQGLPHLEVLQCADAYPAEEMRALARAQPQLRCSWFDKYA